MTEALIITGSNMGDRQTYLQRAIDSLHEAGIITISTSPIYETEPWGDIPQQTYFNQILKVQTKLKAEELLNTMLLIENKLGRIRTEQQFGPRTIDIDLLLYNNLIINTETLILPHPRMHLRRFVLVPACDVAPEWIHPIFNKTLSQLLAECQDVGKVWKLK